MTTVLIIEDNDQLRSSWQDFLHTNKHIKSVHGFGSVEDALETPSIKTAEVILLDIELPGKNGIEGIPLIRKINPDTNILIVSIHNDSEFIFEALKAGAIGYLEKNVTPQELLDAIQSVIEGGSPISPFIAKKVVESFKSQSENLDVTLSEREENVLRLLVEGESYKSLGEKLFLSLDGVRYHIRNIYYKLQVNNKAEAISLAIKRKLI